MNLTRLSTHVAGAPINALGLIALVSCVIATVPASLRWLRVAQREHYLAGSASRFAFRWWQITPVELVAAIVATTAAVVGVFVPGVQIAAAVVVASGPRGLSLHGRTSPLVWTRRLRTVAAVLACLVGVCIAVGAFAKGLAGAAAAAGLVLIVLPLLVDASLALLAPVEDRVALRFVRQAESKVARIHPTIVAITGSYGKTTTKQYGAHLLAGRFTVLASPKSFNNRAGLARSVNELLLPGTDVFIAEMGTYGRGEIAALCAWLPPRIAVITAIGPVHLERFKRLEVTVEAKAEITERAEVTVLNVDDERLAELADRLERAGKSVMRVSASDTAAAVAVVRLDDGLALYRAGVLAGQVQVADEALPAALTNVACAVAVALALGEGPDEILERLAGLPAVANRLEVSRAASGAVVFDDTFNSNPAGAALALAELGRVGTSRARRVVVTPGMVELGRLQGEENERFARAAAEVATDVVVVGRTNRRALSAGVRAAQAAGRTVALRLVATRDDAVAFVRAELGPEDAVLYENDLPDHYG